MNGSIDCPCIHFPACSYKYDITLNFLPYTELVKEIRGSYKINHHLFGNRDKVCLKWDIYIILCIIFDIFQGTGNRLYLHSGEFQ